jgi:MFS family permease
MLLTLGFLSPVIELYLQSFGITSREAGLVYSVYTIAYFISSLAESYISKIFNQRCLICSGILITSLSFLIISQYLVSNNLFVVGFGLGLMGFSSAIMYSNL